MHLLPCHSDHLLRITRLLGYRLYLSLIDIDVTVTTLRKLITLTLEGVTDLLDLQSEVCSTFEYKYVNALLEHLP